jgi:hypothetical protein
MILPRRGGVRGRGKGEERVKVFFLFFFLNDAVKEASLPHYEALINGVRYSVSNNYVAALYLCVIQLDAP